MLEIPKAAIAEEEQVGKPKSTPVARFLCFVLLVPELAGS
jgi:hypothetical protein